MTALARSSSSLPGDAKADAVAAASDGPIDPSRPALLQRRPRVRVVSIPRSRRA